MTKTESEITEIVNRETRAWDTQDVNQFSRYQLMTLTISS
jgi:hypothetical protein